MQTSKQELIEKIISDIWKNRHIWMSVYDVRIYLEKHLPEESPSEETFSINPNWEKITEELLQKNLWDKLESPSDMDKELWHQMDIFNTDEIFYYANRKTMMNWMGKTIEDAMDNQVKMKIQSLPFPLQESPSDIGDRLNSIIELYTQRDESESMIEAWECLKHLKELKDSLSSNKN